MREYKPSALSSEVDMGLAPAISALLAAQREGSNFNILAGIDETSYINKLLTHAEICCHSERGQLRGFIAYYCNDTVSRIAYITLVVVSPEACGRGLGRSLVGYVLETGRARGFSACELEVATDNTAALALYRGLGFELRESRGNKVLMGRTLASPLVQGCTS